MLRFELGNAVGIDRRRSIVSLVRLTRLGAFTIDLDRTDEDEATNTRCYSLPGQVERAIYVDLAELGQRIGGTLAHNMNAGSSMDDDLDTSQCRLPLGFRLNTSNRKGVHPVVASQSDMASRDLHFECRIRQDSSKQRLANKTRSARYQHHNQLAPP
ncbi:hypothetical protein D3C78_1549440 [compost metagenome]